MMRTSPEVLLFGVFIMIIMGAKHWRRSRLRKAVRDLSTPMLRMLGPAPEYDLPQEEPLPDGLESFASTYRRTRYVVYLCWGLAAIWLAYVITLVLGGTAQ